MKAPLLWGFSVSETTHYIENAKNQRLWKESKWLLLGHYEKTFTGYKSTFRGPLFIHPEGFDSPENELYATLDALFSESTEFTKKFTRHPQCQFLARRKWLVEKLNIPAYQILPCEERMTWKKQLGATSVSLIFASSDLGNPASSFGHTFLKLVNPVNAKNKDLVDYGVNYAADGDANEGFFYAFKGLFGMYSGRFTLLPYHQKIIEYINLEGRDIWEYRLNLDSDETDELVSHLLELDGSVSPYYFLSNNCSYQLLVALDSVRPQLQLSRQHPGWVNPIDTVKTITRTQDLVLQTKYKKSLKTDYLESYSHLNLGQKRELTATIENRPTSVSESLSRAEQALVYETALKYLAVKAYRTGNDNDYEKYRISAMRAKLGMIPPELDFKPPTPPEQSHDSSAFYFGYGKVPISEYTSFKLRATFHDLEQDDSGIVPFSQTTLGALEFRYYSEISKFSLERATVINLLNTSPVAPLETNYSWKIRADLLDQLRPDVEFGGGLSYDSNFLATSRIAYFFTGRYFKESRHRYQAGPEILIIARPSDKLGLSINFGYFAEMSAAPYLRFSTKINYRVTANLDIQLQANEQQDYQASLVRNFIF